MIDPEEQLRRLAAGRADQVEPFRPADRDAEVIALPRRRWLAAAAAAVVLALVGAGVLAVVTAAGDGDSEFVGEVAPDGAGDDTVDDGSVPGEEVEGGGDDGLDGDEVQDAETTPTTAPAVSTVSIPDVIGTDVETASAALTEAGVRVEIETVYVKEPALAGEVVDVIEVPPTPATVDEPVVQVVIAHFAATTLATDPCTRPAHLLADVDADALPDRIHPRVTDERITGVEVCTGAGVRTVVDGLDLHRIETAVDLDGDGADDLVVAIDEFGVGSRVLSFVDDELVVWPGVLAFGTVVVADGVESTSWWGCADLGDGPSRLVAGTVTNGGDGGWVLSEVIAPTDDAGVAPRRIEGGGSVDEAATARCRGPVPAPGPCAIDDIEVALAGDVDGDGVDDVISPRDGIACLLGDDPVVVDLGAAARLAATWFLDDIDDDGRLELFLGRITDTGLEARPWVISRDRSIAPAADDDCCVQTDPAVAPSSREPESATSGPVEPARWFSCVAGRDGRPGELVSGRFWIDRAPSDAINGEGTPGGVVQWTIDVGSLADPEIVYRTEFEQAVATDAWIPGNGCRGRAGLWRPPVEIELGEGFAAGADAVAAFNASIAGDDLARRVVRLREALGIAATLQEASGPYREDVAQGFFEVAGLRDDSTGALRWDYEFTDDGAALVSVSLSWSCAPGRGHADFSTEPCV